MDSRILYAEVDWKSTRAEKFALLEQMGAVSKVSWGQLTPDARNNWIVAKYADEFLKFPPMGAREVKSAKGDGGLAVFKVYSIGLNTNRDDWVYSFDRQQLIEQVGAFIETYNSEIDRWRRAKKPKDIDSFVLNDEKRIKWSSRLKETFLRELYAEFQEAKIRRAVYRPFASRWLFFDPILNHRQALFRQIFPTESSLRENQIIVVGGYGRKEFAVLVAHAIADLNFYADPAQCFPFYVYDEDGTNRRENITDWALQQFRTHYGDDTISKWDIFYYVYGLLHHPGYRTKFADNLKRELPRIPFAPGFRAFAAAGKELAALHLDYEKLQPYSLKWLETEGVPLSYKVEDKMRLTKDKTALRVNPSLTLAGIPPETFQYRLGNRSALEWVIDQYQISEDKRSGIRSDPNRPDDLEYIVRLVGQVVRVSLETVRIVNGLPERYTETNHGGHGEHGDGKKTN
jgi:predicted helicase